MINPSLTRRTIVCSAALSLAPFPLSAKPVEESQAGDPEGPFEKLQVDSAEWDGMLSTSRASFEPKLKSFRGSPFLKHHLGWGKTALENKEDVTRLLALFNLKFDGAKGPTPYCAAGVSFVAAMVYARQKNLKGEITLATIQSYVAEVNKYHFFPTPNVEGMHLVSRAKDNWVPPVTKEGATVTPKPGWLILFQWDGQNHVGVIENALKGRIQTIEFNTSPEGVPGSQRQGGAVARRNRSYPSKFVRGFIST